MANSSNFKTCISSNNQPFMTRPTLTDLNPENIIKGCITVHLCLIFIDAMEAVDPSSRIPIPNKTEDITLSVFNVITRINESKTLAKLFNTISTKIFP